ncbi:MAG: hypothetical protein OER95_13935, partial [Acidimicrobiia bacterium]|nr:hypothetical protein [Acidimicrobiia bacterium]
TEAIDLMVAAAAAGSTAQQAADLVALVQTVEGLMAAGDERPPPWLDDIESDLDLLEALSARAPSARDEDDDEAFGRTGRGWIRLREGLSRFRTAIPAATGRAAGRVVRPRIHDQAATFVGDILVYLDRAGSAGATSKILTSVGDTIEQASQERSAADPLVVLAHSMGGNIVYDLLSYFKPDLDVDTLVTVGSQVGLFQELDLFAAKHPALNPPADKVPRPDNIGRWINIYDRNDVLGFAVGRVFDGVTDFEYSTGLGFVKAHSGYFIRPSFYRRLAARLVA